MKRFSLREFVLLSAPTALIVLAGVGSYVRQQRSLTSKISLTLGLDKSRSVSLGKDQVSFAWEGRASRKWEGYYRVGYDERIVGFGPRGEQTLYLNPTTAKGGDWLRFSTTTSDFGPIVFGGRLQAPLESIPIGINRLEWRGVVVALTNQGETLIEPVEKTNLDSWSRLPGAVTIRKTIPIKVPTGALEPIQECKLEKVNPSNAALGADTCITTRWRDNQRKYYVRLVAFDGKTHRTLPIEPSDSDASYYVTQEQGSIGSIWYSHLLLKLRDVPASWGTLTFLVDVVYDPSPTGTHGDACDASTIKKLKKQGWLHFSRRLTVRAQGQTIKAVSYPKTPNCQLLGVKNWLSPTKWIVEARLRYIGHEKEPNLDSPTGPEFYDSKWNFINSSGESYIIERTKMGAEWVAHIEVPRANLKGLAKRETITMKMEVADTQAAPLTIRQQLHVPAGVASG